MARASKVNCNSWSGRGAFASGHAGDFASWKDAGFYQEQWGFRELLGGSSHLLSRLNIFNISGI